MFDTLNSAPSVLIAAGVAVLVAIFAFLSLRTKKQIRHDFERQRQISKGLAQKVTKTNNQLQEVRSVVVGLGQKVSQQQEVIRHLSERVTELEHMDSDSRLYSRASKMVQLGAGVEELIEECELPKAEAELMMALQQKMAATKKTSLAKRRHR